MQVELSNRHLAVIFYGDCLQWDEIVVSPEDFPSLERALTTFLEDGTLCYIGRSSEFSDLEPEKPELSSVSAFHCFSSSLRRQLAMRIGQLGVLSARRSVMAFNGTPYTDPEMDRVHYLSSYNSLAESSSPLTSNNAGFLPNWLFSLLDRKGSLGYNMVEMILDQVSLVVEAINAGNLPLEAYTDRRNGLYRGILERI